MRLQTWRGSGEVNGGQQRSTEVNTNQQQESTQVNRSQQKSTEVNEIASPNLEGVNTSQRRSTEVNKNAAPNLEGVNKGQERSTEVKRSQQQKYTEVPLTALFCILNAPPLQSSGLLWWSSGNLEVRKFGHC